MPTKGLLLSVLTDRREGRDQQAGWTGLVCFDLWTTEHSVTSCLAHDKSRFHRFTWPSSGQTISAAYFLLVSTVICGIAV